MIQQSHSWTYTCTDLSLKKTHEVYIHNGILLSHKKKNIMPFAATGMELETLILSEMSQKDKDKYHMISLITGI